MLVYTRNLWTDIEDSKKRFLWGEGSGAGVKDLHFTDFPPVVFELHILLLKLKITKNKLLKRSQKAVFS